MISNATILRIDTPKTPTAQGKVDYARGRSLSVRCAIDSPKTSTAWGSDRVTAEATAVLYVLRRVMQLDQLKLKDDFRVVVRLDGEAEETAYQVLAENRRVKGHLSHGMFALRVVV